MNRSRPIFFWLGLLAGLAGVALAAYLSVKSSPRMMAVAWLPAWLSLWADQHGQFRNFPAFGCIALPFLLTIWKQHLRCAIVVGLGLLIVTLELIQIKLPARSPDPWDVFWAWLGLLAAWASSNGLRWVWHKFAPQARPAAR